MFGTVVSEEMEVNVAAKTAWELYGGIELSNLAVYMPQIFHKVEVVKGDGGVGTILHIIFTPGLTSYKEKFTKIDNEKLVKEVEAIEGMFHDMGFTLYRIRFEIIEKTKDSCATRATIEYELKEEAAANASAVSIKPLVTIMETAANYLLKNKQN